MERLKAILRALPFAATVVVFLALSLAPAVQKMSHFFSEEHLTGITTLVPRPGLPPWTDWKTGRYQKHVDEWWAQWFGFRGALVKTENQLNFSVFHTVSSGANTKIVLGKNNFLYEKAYINSYHARDAVPVTTLEQQIVQLKKLEDALRKEGKAFVFLVTPSKASVYPEYLPLGLDLERPGTPATNYEQLVPLLAPSGLTYVDAHAFLVEQKKMSATTLFPSGGTHWNYYSACQVSSLVMKRVAEQLKKNTPDVVCDPPALDTKPQGTDKDLAELLNLWQPYAHGQIAHPSLIKDTRPGLYRPAAVLVGGSFVWTVVGVLDSVQAYRTRDFYYYYSRISRYPGTGELEDFNKESMDWDTALKNVDAVIVEANETALSTIGFGFVEDVLNGL